MHIFNDEYSKEIELYWGSKIARGCEGEKASTNETSNQWTKKKHKPNKRQVKTKLVPKPSMSAWRLLYECVKIAET